MLSLLRSHGTLSSSILFEQNASCLYFIVWYIIILLILDQHHQVLAIIFFQTPLSLLVEVKRMLLSSLHSANQQDCPLPPLSVSSCSALPLVCQFAPPPPTALCNLQFCKNLSLSYDGTLQKKSVTTKNYEEFGILCSLKPAVKMQEKKQAKCKLTTLKPLFSKPAKLEMEQRSSKTTNCNTVLRTFSFNYMQPIKDACQLFLYSLKMR